LNGLPAQDTFGSVRGRNGGVELWATLHDLPG